MARREYQCPNVLRRTGRNGDEWYIRYRVKVLRTGADGKPEPAKREKFDVLGLCAKLTKRQAERARDAILAKVNAQSYSIQSQIPFSDFVKLYRERRLPGLRATTQATYDQWLRLYIEPYFDGKNLCDVSPQDIHIFITSLELAPLTRRSIRGVLASLFNLAIAWGYWSEQSPVRQAFLVTKLGGERKRSPRIWTMEELQKILLSVRTDVRLMIETLVWTGMRISECLGLRWGSVNVGKGFIRVHERQCRGDVGKPKSLKGYRWLPLESLGVKFTAIRGEAKDADLVFHQQDGREYHDNKLLVNYMDPILRSLKLKFAGAGWHQFRRMHLTWFSEQGTTPFEIQTQAGHASMETTMIYVQPSMDRRASAVAAMQAKFLELCGTNAESGLIQ